MTGKVAMAFEPDSVTIAVADILPMRLVDDSVRNSRKFQQIGASVREIGIVQPPIVARRPELKGKYLLLDGHLRIEILKDMKVDQVTCLVSLDDEAVTYNRQVNRLTPVQEHKMILKVIERGIPEQRIAQALNVDVASIRIKRELHRKVDIRPLNPHISSVERRLDMTRKAPGKSHREGLTLVQLMDMFPTEEAASAWFESVVWPNGRHCPKCGSVRTGEASHAKMPYWCTDCRSYFSVKTGTAMQASKIPLRKWVIAVYLCLTNLKSVSSMKLHRDIGVTQATAWFMLQRIREAWAVDDDDDFDGPVEVDETYFGGERRNMSIKKRKAMNKSRGPVGKTAVVGVKDRDSNEVRAEVVQRTDGATLQGFVREHTEPGATVYTDDAAAYRGMAEFDHEAVNHTVSEYVRGMAHTNGIESFWAMLKRAHDGTFHKMSPKHLQRYVSEFAGKHNHRESGTVVQMRNTVARLVGRNLLYRDLIADNGLSSGSGA